MKFIVLAIFMVFIAPAVRAVDSSPLYKEPDAQSKFQDAQLHVKKLMNTGQYQEAAKYMPVYQRLACEATEQKAGRSAEEGTAICANKNNRGDIAGSSTSSALQQLDRSATTSSNVLAPGITVMPRSIPGSSTALDGSTPSLLMFDPRSDPGTSFKRPDPPAADPWTGKP